MLALLIRCPLVQVSIALGFLSIVTGCGPGGVDAPPVDPVAATDAALAQLDKNGDQALDQTELVGSPPLAAALAEYDLNGDKKADRDELLLRLKGMYESEVGLTTAECMVTLDGRPLPGATVIYVPETYLGEGTTQKAGGITNESGQASLGLPPEAQQALPENLRKTPMIQVGLYRVKITHPSKKLPPRYNESTELGFEVHPDAHEGPNSRFDLKSR